MKQPTPFTLAALTALALATLPPARARAADPSPRLEVTPLVGAWLAAGQARDDFADAPLGGAQLAWELDPRLAVVGTFAWAPTSAKRLGDAALDLFQYDLGLRGQLHYALGGGLSVRPFLGVGVGLRTFSFRDAGLAGGTGFLSYGSAGAVLGYRALAVGVTVRHEVSTPDATALDISTPRQDVALFTSVGLRF